MIFVTWLPVKFSIKKNQFAFGQNTVLLLLGIAVFAVFFFITMWGQGGLVDLYRLSVQKRALVANNRELMIQNLLSLEELERLKSVKYLEQSARHHLGFVLPNEKVYLVK